MNLTQVRPQDSSAASAKSAAGKTLSQDVQNQRESSFDIGEPLFYQPRLMIGAVNDPMEHEADAFADRIVRMPMSGAVFSGVNAQSPAVVQRKCEACKDEEEEMHGKVRRKENAGSPSGGVATNALSRQIQSTRGGGQAIEGQTRRLMENGFGRDLSNVRIHTGGYAAQMNRDLQAHAFTVGSDIYFNAGRYAPESQSGRHLLAHELTHVMQQSHGIHRMPIIQRVCDTSAYDTRVAQIRTLPLFVTIPPDPQQATRHSLTPTEALQKANDLMRDARLRDNCMYYADALHTLFSTAETPPTTIDFAPRMAASARGEAARLLTTFGSTNRQFEENLSGDASRRFVPISTRGKSYELDARDPANVVVKIKVFPSSGDPTAIANLIATEDAIEKKASVAGYTVDLIFVTAPGPDVYEVGVDPNAWPDAGNFVQDTDTYAHELHHLLGLDDRYNYIDTHSGNDQMLIVDRVRWFDVEFRRAQSTLINVSFMGSGSLVTDQDICDAMHAPDMAACLVARRAVRQPAIDAKNATRSRVLRIIEILQNVNTSADERAAVLARGTATMGSDFIQATVITQLIGLSSELDTAELQLENASGTECENESLTHIVSPHAFIVCPAFSLLTAPQKAQQLVKAAARLNAVGLTVAQELGSFIAGVFDPTAAPTAPVAPVAPAARIPSTTLMFGVGGGSEFLALIELQQRIALFGPRTPGGILLPIPLQLTLGAYGLPARGSLGASLGVSTDLRFASRGGGTPWAFGMNLGVGGTAGGTNIGSVTGTQPELGAYGRTGLYFDSSAWRITPQYQFNFLRNMGAGTDAQIHSFLFQLGYAF